MNEAATAPGANIPAGDLDGLRRAVCRRAGQEVLFQNNDAPHMFPAVDQRLQQALNGRTETGQAITNNASMIRLFEDLEADLRGLLALPADEFRRCVLARATNPRGFNANHGIQAEQQARIQAMAPPMPRIQPRELLARLASAGVIVQALDGNLHVQPAELLSEADRSALAANKAALLEALSAPATVI